MKTESLDEIRTDLIIKWLAILKISTDNILM